ncbi:MAG: hypothetical protein WCR20_20100, partial [Verrucomicrobiota bacterium]
VKLRVHETLPYFAEEHNLKGWVRSSDVLDPKVILAQIERLQTENTELRKKVGELEAVPEKPERPISEDAIRLLTKSAETGTH